MGFDRTATVQIDEVCIAPVTVVSANQIDVTVRQATTMDGRRIRVKTATARATFYSYLRTAPIGSSSRALLNHTEPIFAAQRYTQAYVSSAATGSQYNALALQNPTDASNWVTVDLLRSNGQTITSNSLLMPARSRVIRDLAELFASTAGGTTVCVSSASGVQVLGLLADDANFLVVPVPPATALP